MTTEQELNEKLARWAGFKEELTEDDEGAKYRSWRTDRQFVLKADFTQSLDACFKWLVPKLEAMGFGVSVGRSADPWGCPTFAHIFFPHGEPKASVESKDLPALALCRAIEQLIDQEVKE